MFKQIFEIFKSDSLYEQALSECHKMLDIDLSMYKESIKSLRESDSADIDIDIYEMDKKINEFERDVRRKVMTHLAVGGKEDIGSGCHNSCLHGMFSIGTLLLGRCQV